MKILKILSFFILFYVLGFSQETKLWIEVAAYGGGATDSLQPLWNYANQWGTFNKFAKGEGVFTSKVYYHFLDKEHLSMRVEVSGVLNADINESFVQEAFLRMKFYWLDISGGMEAYSPVAYDDDLTSGMFLMSSNARPVPRVTAGIFDYLPLGFTKQWVEIRGGMSQGFLWDDRGTKGNSHVLLHEKWAYIRLGNVKWQPYAGLVHSALFGGTKPNGDKIPIDFWATFRGGASERLGETNATGAHMGLWDFGVYFPVKEWNGHVYYQKPFADGSGKNILNFKNKDFYLGVMLKSKDRTALSGLSLEYIKTSWQSGPGTPDPYDPEEEHIVFIGDIEDIDKYMMERFGMETEDWSKVDLREFLMDEWNYGYEFGGRDDYMNNGQYYAGWTYNGLSMGLPLYHTTEQVRHYAKDWNFQDRMFFINNRVNSFHVGVEGWINEQFFYRFKGTYTNNKGSYGEEYYGRYSWDKTQDYFFEGSKNQFYTGLEVNWQMKPDLPIKIIGVVGYDFGELYHSFGGRLGVVYKIGSPTPALP